MFALANRTYGRPNRITLLEKFKNDPHRNISIRARYEDLARKVHCGHSGSRSIPLVCLVKEDAIDAEPSASTVISILSRAVASSTS